MTVFFFNLGFFSKDVLSVSGNMKMAIFSMLELDYGSRMNMNGTNIAGLQHKECCAHLCFQQYRCQSFSFMESGCMLFV